MKLTLTIAGAVAALTLSSQLRAEGVGTYGFPDEPNGVQSRDGLCYSEQTVRDGVDTLGGELVFAMSNEDSTEMFATYFMPDDGGSFMAVTIWSDGLWCVTGSYTSAEGFGMFATD